jgi:hypothetical protein
MEFTEADLEDAERVSLKPPGWTGLEIDYAKVRHTHATWLVWRIEGTEKIWSIDMQTVYKHHGGQFEDHFTTTLDAFRTDFLDWAAQEFSEPWMRKYMKQFGHKILY